MGDFKLLREIVLVPQSAWDIGVQATRAVGLPAPASPGGTVPPSRPRRALTALELGQVGSLRRVCRLRLGLPAVEGVAAVVPTAVASGTVLSAGLVPPTMVPRKVKMSSIFDQEDDTEIAPWTPARFRWRASRSRRSRWRASRPRLSLPITVRRHLDRRGGHGGERRGLGPVSSIAVGGHLGRRRGHGGVHHGLGLVCQVRSDVTATDTVVTEESVTALTQYCQLLSASP